MGDYQRHLRGLRGADQVGLLTVIFSPLLSLSSLSRLRVYKHTLSNDSR